MAQWRSHGCSLQQTFHQGKEEGANGPFPTKIPLFAAGSGPSSSCDTLPSACRTHEGGGRHSWPAALGCAAIWSGEPSHGSAVLRAGSPTAANTVENKKRRRRSVRNQQVKGEPPLTETEVRRECAPRCAQHIGLAMIRSMKRVCVWSYDLKHEEGVCVEL
jgi:hypothetical protein